MGGGGGVVGAKTASNKKCYGEKKWGGELGGLGGSSGEWKRVRAVFLDTVTLYWDACGELETVARAQRSFHLASIKNGTRKLLFL